MSVGFAVEENRPELPNRILGEVLGTEDSVTDPNGLIQAPGHQLTVKILELSETYNPSPADCPVLISSLY
jgi:hypothetical protein